MSSTLKIISWNVNGLQGILKKDTSGTKTTLTKLKQSGEKNALAEMVTKEDPDIICFQEIKCSDKFNHNKIACLTKYPYKYVNHATNRKGYSGTLVVSKTKPLKVTNNFVVPSGTISDTYKADDMGLTKEGRLITLEYDSFILVNVYVPNSGVSIKRKDGTRSPGLGRLSWRVETWETIMRNYISALMIAPQGTSPSRDRKSVIVIGDLNVIYSSQGASLDTYRSIIGQNFAGSMPEERNAFKNLLDIGLIDTFRYLHPNERKLSWHYSSNRKQGYRLDYALVSRSDIEKIKSSDILNEYLGSDHSPIIIQLSC